ncbi:13964_t:CDS:2 [Funneliformis geosporum]|uniref:13964_t:CDS:1 n=1 Tax=Funneliformis geosporum TaxID=1117311 RepID=A0A9W4SNS3_9GLOM|nr:13964_t:CDS:2 [Funneliformis geosporum]
MKKEFIELISDPIIFNEQSQRVFKHADLPMVRNELSVTLRLKLQSHTPYWAVVFHKGTEWLIRTPRLVLIPNKSSLHARFSGKLKNNLGIDELGDGLLLDKWYHIAYTLSDSKKRLDIYIDGEWVGFYGIQDVKSEQVVFNDGPLYIGRTSDHGSFIGKIRYEQHRNKIALVHVSTNKYLSTKGKKYDKINQYMVVGNGREIDLKNDVWTFIGPSGTSVIAENPVPFNTIIGFNHQATGGNLHSHDMNDGRITPISKQQQVTINPGRSRDDNRDDEFFIQRYNSKAFKDHPVYLMNGDEVCLFHITTNKPALYSNSILFSDGTQEVSCHGNGNDENNKWRIELVD